MIGHLSWWRGGIQQLAASGSSVLLWPDGYLRVGKYMPLLSLSMRRVWLESASMWWVLCDRLPATLLVARHLLRNQFFLRHQVIN